MFGKPKGFVQLQNEAFWFGSNLKTQKGFVNYSLSIIN